MKTLFEKIWDRYRQPRAGLGYGLRSGPNTPALSAAEIDAAAQLLDAARRARVPIAVLSQERPHLNERDAYAIAAAGIALRPHATAGFKLGYTSEAMRRQMHVDQPNYGRLCEDTQIANGAKLDIGNLIHPLIEPEIALRVGRDIDPGERTYDRIAQAVDAVMPALEIVDTRYVSYTFTAVDNIADNSSAARFVLGPPSTLRSLGDLRAVPARLYADGTAIAAGTGSDALGDPVLALAWLIERLAHDGEHLRAGTIVLTGGLTRAHPVAGVARFTATFGVLGDVALVIP